MGYLTLASRLKRLESGLVKSRCATFLLRGGHEFSTKEDPINYLVRNGAKAPDGRKIIGCCHPEGDMDALSASLYEFIDSVIKDGTESFLNLDDVEQTKGENRQ